MVAISRQYLSGADKAVQMRRSVFIVKGALPDSTAQNRNRLINQDIRPSFCLARLR